MAGSITGSGGVGGAALSGGKARQGSQKPGSIGRAGGTGAEAGGTAAEAAEAGAGKGATETWVELMGCLAQVVEEQVRGLSLSGIPLGL